MPQNLQAAVAAVLKERQPGDTPEMILQRVKDRMAQPAEDPTPFFIQQREQAGETVYDTPQVSPDEPTTWIGGFLKSLKDQTLENTVGNPQVQSAANPQTLGDFLQFAIPSGVNTAVRALANTVPTRLKQAGQAMVDFGKTYASGKTAVLGNTARGMGRLLSSDVGDLLHGRFSPDVVAIPPRRLPAVQGGTLRPSSGSPSLAEEALSGLDGMGQVQSVELAPPPTITDPVVRTSGRGPAGRAVYYSSGRPSTSEEVAADMLSRNPETRLVTPSAGNRGGTLTAGAPSQTPRTLEEELASALSPTPQGPPSVELPTRGDMTKGGRPAITPQQQEEMIRNTENAPNRTRLVNPNSANRGGALVPGQPARTLEEELLSGLSESAGPSSVELPPQPGMTDASTARQSGRFSKKKSVGQAGRYDSGRPGITKTQQSDIEDDLATMDAIQNPSTRRMGAWSPETAGGDSPLVQEALQPSAPVKASEPVAAPAEGVSTGPTLQEAMSKVEQNPRALPEQLDPTGWTREDWQNARDIWGSNNVSKMTGVSQQEVQKLAPMKRGRPLYVDMIQREDEARRRFEWE